MRNPCKSYVAPAIAASKRRTCVVSVWSLRCREGAVVRRYQSPESFKSEAALPLFTKPGWCHIGELRLAANPKAIVDPIHTWEASDVLADLSMLPGLRFVQTSAKASILGHLVFHSSAYAWRIARDVRLLSGGLGVESGAAASDLGRDVAQQLLLRSGWIRRLCAGPA
jgi:hypothetical protein